jgi:hypothetical protein
MRQNLLYSELKIQIFADYFSIVIGYSQDVSV